MAEITCCSSGACNGLLTLGYMRSLIPSNKRNCYSINDGPAFSSCCNAPGSSMTVTYAQATGNTFPKRDIKTNPENDKGGFSFSVPTGRTNNSCCPVNSGNTILKESEVSFGYTKAFNNYFSNAVNPDTCNLTYSVTENRIFERYTISCNGSESVTTASTAITHSDKISKSFNFEQVSNGKKWNVEFGTVNINGITEDECGVSVTSQTSFTVNKYAVGYSLGANFSDYCGTSREIPCAGGVTLEFEYSANTSCITDFSIGVEVSDNTITATTGNPTYTTVGLARIAVYKVSIAVGQNINSHPTDTITITPTVGGEEKSEGVYICEFRRQLCAWNARTRSGEYCNGMFPNICWDNESSDVEEIDKNGCTDC